MKPTILFLGASPQQLAPVAYARSAGYRVVTCDNRPQNPGHALADASHNVSTLDREGVLRVAERESISAVVCYASDVSAPTAAFVADQLGLPGNPLAAVELLTNKTQFRRWQTANGYWAPDHCQLDSGSLGEAPATVAQLLERFSLPMVLKPVDASGAKGVSVVRHAGDVLPALVLAIKESISGEAIVEAFVERDGFQVCGEGFLVDGAIDFVAFADEHFTAGIHVPVGETFPSTHDPSRVARATDVLQDMFGRLGMRQGAFNFDLFFTPSGEVFIVEIGPRNGGNRMPDAVKLGYGVDLIAATVEAALGKPVDLHGHAVRPCATYSIHAKADGRLGGIAYSAELERCIHDREQFVPIGAPAFRFRMGSQMIGNLILAFDSMAQMLSTLARMDELVHVALLDPLELT